MLLVSLFLLEESVSCLFRYTTDHDLKDLNSRVLPNNDGIPTIGLPNSFLGVTK